MPWASAWARSWGCRSTFTRRPPDTRHAATWPTCAGASSRGLAEKMRDPVWTPDCGPQQPHPTAGAVAVGARTFLVAYNVNLGTADVAVAKAVARAVRARTGGLANVKALGVLVEKDGRPVAQVTMNLTDPFQTPLYRVFELVRLEAERYGVPVSSSEIVGLVPLEVLLDAARYYLRLDGFAPEQVLETRLWAAT